MCNTFRSYDPPKTIPYVVKPSDTFVKLARRFNTSLAAIFLCNPHIDHDFLRVGQRIDIPRQQLSSSCPEGNQYTVRPGDTLHEIARLFNISINDLLDANPEIDPDRLFVGKIICVPLSPSQDQCPEGSIPYVVQAGDNFYSIAQRATTTVEALVQANPGLNPNELYVGQQICVPIPRPHFR